jgi:integrase
MTQLCHNKEMKILTLPNGKFRVDIIIAGVRERRNFSSRAMAESFLKQSQVEIYERKLGMERLTHKQRATALEVFRILPPNVEVIDIVLKHLRTTRLDLTYTSLQDALELFLESLRTGNRRESYIKSIGKTLRRFSRDSNCELTEIDPINIEKFLKVCPSPVSRFNYIRDLHVFFEWCRVEKYIQFNPVAEIRRPLVHRKEPVILTVDQCQALLENTSEGDRAFAAIGLFTGARPNEIRQMTWEMVNETSIRLPAEITKTHTSRTIQLEPNAMAWLDPLKIKAPRMAAHEGSQGKRLCLATGLKSWPQGALRHTFASYHVTAFENPSRTALFMHSRLAPDILFRHYFKDSLKSEALRFWQLLPKD